MRSLLVTLVLVACKGGADEAARDNARDEARRASERAAAEKEMAPYRELEQRYEKAARDAIAAHQPHDGTADLEKMKGRKIAPILATKTYPSGEQRPVGHLWCSGRCEKEPWIASAPTAAGVLVIADAAIVDGGKWVSENRAGEVVKELGKAYIHRYEVRAVLVPEDVVVARWTRYGMLPGMSDQELMPVRGEEMSADIAALFAGNAPVEEGQPPKTSLGGY
jgi:hypothetical protein